MFRSFGWPEIALILVIVLIVFGVGRLPQVGGAIGKAIRNFRQTQKGEESEDDGESDTKIEAKTESSDKKLANSNTKNVKS